MHSITVFNAFALLLLIHYLYILIHTLQVTPSSLLNFSNTQMITLDCILLLEYRKDNVITVMGEDSKQYYKRASH